MDSATRKEYKKIMYDYLKTQAMPDYYCPTEPTDSYRTILDQFLEYIYDYDPLMLEYPEDYPFDADFFDYIKAEYTKYCFIRNPQEDAKYTAKWNAEVILTVSMSDGDIREYDSATGEEDFLYDFCEDIRDIVGEDFASEEIDDVAKEIYFYGLSKGKLSENQIYSLAEQYLFGN